VSRIARRERIAAETTLVANSTIAAMSDQFAAEHLSKKGLAA